MGTRTYSRRAADGSRKPTALGIRTGRYRGTGEPAYASASIPQGWTGSDGDVGIYKDVGDMRISIVPSGFESRGGRAYYALQISNPRDDEQSPYSLVLSRNTESSWEDLQNEAKELTDLLEETMTYNNSMGFSVDDNGTLTIVDNDNDTQMTITRNGEWESEATEYDPAYGVTYGAGGVTGSDANPLTALRNALMDFGMRSEEAYLRRAGIAEPRTLLTRTPATYRPLTPIQRTLTSIDDRTQLIKDLKAEHAKVRRRYNQVARERLNRPAINRVLADERVVAQQLRDIRESISRELKTLRPMVRRMTSGPLTPAGRRLMAREEALRRQRDSIPRWAMKLKASDAVDTYSLPQPTLRSL